MHQIGAHFKTKMNKLTLRRAAMHRLFIDRLKINTRSLHVKLVQIFS